MQGLCFLRKKFYFSQRFKHALPIIDKKFVREICKVCAFWLKIFQFTAFWTRSTNHQLKIRGWKMQGLCFLCEEFHFLQCS